MLERFGMTAERGFLPINNPLQSLRPPFEPWEKIAADLPKLLMGGRIRQWFAALPLLDPAPLHGPQELERAMLLLSYFGHAWVWGEQIVSQSVPPQIAVPWHAVAARLGRPPVLSYASHVLNNWRLLVETRPITLDNIVRLMNFYGGLDEEWFVLIHIVIESQAGHALDAGIKVQEAVQAGDAPAVTGGLRALSDAIVAFSQTLARMPERCDPYIYYTRVRPFIFGWHSNPALPDGLIYEGVDVWNGQPQTFRGETGAQSSIIPSLDAVLGLTFDGSPEFMKHLAELREYMPPQHCAFISALEKAEQAWPIRQFIALHLGTDPAMVSAYNNAVFALHGFRALHLKFAQAFIAKQQPATSSNPTETGTGGTPFIAYLASHMEQTLDHKIHGAP